MVVIESACDWIRITDSDFAKFYLYESIFEAAWLDAFAGGGKKQNRSMLGYDGQGFEHGFLGQRNDGFMIQITGAAANDYLHRLLSFDGNVTRIDVQVTVRTESYDGEYGKRALYEAERRRAEGGTHYSKSRMRLIDGRGEGDTVQIGRRVSEKWGRLYDKQKESCQDIYFNSWRYEIEYKGNPAKFVAALLRKQDIATTVRQVIRQQYQVWGFAMDWLESVEIDLYKYRRSTYDKDRVLSWLAKQVNPSIQKLLQNGVCLQEITLALGLTSE